MFHLVKSICYRSIVSHQNMVFQMNVLEYCKFVKIPRRYLMRPYKIFEKCISLIDE